MKVAKIYITMEEFSDYVKSKLHSDDLLELGDCTFVPLKIGLNETDFSIEAIVVAAKN